MDSFKTASLTTEVFREYHYENGAKYRIDGPVTLYYKTDERGDTHRVLDSNGMTHYVRRGWLAISWHAPAEPVSF